MTTSEHPYNDGGIVTMAEMIDFESERVSRHLDKVFRSFLVDPCHSEFQQGYLMALIDLYREGMGKGEGEERIAQLEAQVRKAA